MNRGSSDRGTPFRSTGDGCNELCTDLSVRAPELAELQAIGLEILSDIDAVCEEHGIRYYLAEGTLLGAIRHNGFIPWDDDVDIAMPRSDYERFLQVAPAALGSRYEVQHPGSVHRYWSPFAKVRLLDADSQYRQQHIAHLTKNNGPLVDVFPLDSSPVADGFGLRLRGQLMRLNRAAITQKLRMVPAKSLQKIIARAYGSILPLSALHGQLNWIQTSLSGPNDPYLVNFCSYYPVSRQVFPAAYYGTPRMHEFEGRLFPIPEKAEAILRGVYGEYHILPDVSARYSKHHFGVDSVE